jgi:hypothetical protein
MENIHYVPLPLCAYLENIYDLLFTICSLLSAIRYTLYANLMHIIPNFGQKSRKNGSMLDTPAVAKAMAGKRYSILEKSFTAESAIYKYMHIYL